MSSMKNLKHAKTIARHRIAFECKLNNSYVFMFLNSKEAYRWDGWNQRWYSIGKWSWNALTDRIDVDDSWALEAWVESYKIYIAKQTVV